MRRSYWRCLVSVLFLGAVGGCAVGGGGGGGGNDNVADNDNTADNDNAVDNDNTAEEAERFSADLSGDNEVEPITSSVTGTATLEAFTDRIEFNVTVSGDANVTINAAHIHLGGADENGPVVAFLTPEDFTIAPAEGLTVAGEITAADLLDVLLGAPLEDLVQAFRDGGAYVNVHSLGNPGGECRGQIGPD